ncbi:MAG: hypothetical protein ACJAVK_003204, partial [Akkermansiaceae bacterium]
APPRELARRLSFGLTGLPPSPADLTQFEADFKDAPSQAVLQFGNRLMATPHYGEHFARHWLDVSRYADSGGFANDYYRPHAWRYRDYVVRSFNQDKPHPNFVREQIAGDELDNPTSDSLIATGFLRMGPWEQTAMSVFKETRQFWLDDVTNSVGQTFLAHAMQCAKCHDHKFDPIPTRDYYRMMAVFSTTQFAEHDVNFLPRENRNYFQSSQKLLSAKLGRCQNQQSEISQKMKANRKTETGDAKVGDNGLDPGDEVSNARIGKNIERHTIEGDRIKPRAHGVYTGKTIKRNNVKGRLQPSSKPWQGSGYLEKDTILTGGDVYSIGDPVTPGALSAAESLGGMTPTKFPGDKGKRRFALANWITAERNPLTARVIVNRVWSWHFGQGLAGNPNNFGGTGAIPTHPELLDHLAHWFVKNGWSLKKLNKLIISSETYQRNSRHPDPALLKKADPLPKQRNRRSLYAEKLRGLRAPFFEIFNQPGSSNSCESRETSTVAPQALTLMNAEETQRKCRTALSPSRTVSSKNRKTIHRPSPAPSTSPSAGPQHPMNSSPATPSGKTPRPKNQSSFPKPKPSPQSSSAPSERKKQANSTLSKNTSPSSKSTNPTFKAVTPTPAPAASPTSASSSSISTSSLIWTKTMAHHFNAQPTRREALYGLGAGLGSVAFSSLLQAAGAKTSYHPAKAKRCIFLMMEGGPSHLDTFDPKPELTKRHLQQFNRSGEAESAMSSGQRYFVKSPFEFEKAGKSGADISSEWVHLKKQVDDICFYRGAQVDSVNHPTACYQLNTGNRFGGDPGIGSWVTYGLGTENENLPGFVVLPRSAYPQGGAGNWSNGFLPADFQGTPLRPEGSPILDLNPPAGISRTRQRQNLDLLGLDDNKLTYYHAGRHKQLSQFGGQVIPQLIG